MLQLESFSVLFTLLCKLKRFVGLLLHRNLLCRLEEIDPKNMMHKRKFLKVQAYTNVKRVFFKSCKLQKKSTCEQPLL